MIIRSGRDETGCSAMAGRLAVPKKWYYCFYQANLEKHFFLTHKANFSYTSHIKKGDSYINSTDRRSK